MIVIVELERDWDDCCSGSHEREEKQRQDCHENRERERVLERLAGVDMMMALNKKATTAETIIVPVSPSPVVSNFINRTCRTARDGFY
jgi:hypothetical protein